MPQPHHLTKLDDSAESVSSSTNKRRTGVDDSIISDRRDVQKRRKLIQQGFRYPADKLWPLLLKAIEEGDSDPARLLLQQDATIPVDKLSQLLVRDFEKWGVCMIVRLLLEQGAKFQADEFSKPLEGSLVR